MTAYLSDGMTFGKPDTYDKRGNRQVPYSETDLALLSYHCGIYEYNRQQLNIVAKLKGLEEDVVQGRHQ